MDGLEEEASQHILVYSILSKIGHLKTNKILSLKNVLRMKEKVAQN